MQSSSTNQLPSEGSGSAPVPAAFAQDPLGYLTSVASQPPSRNALDMIADPVAPSVSSLQESEATVAIATAYLKAAAVHLKEITAVVGNPEVELAKTKQQLEIVTAVGACASLCKSRRRSIAVSGILPTLAQLVLNDTAHPPSQLTQTAVEFLQCALLAEHYRYAIRVVGATWPTPTNTVSVKEVLRYYYLRGMIHLGGNDFTMAHRCFWTCLSIPSEITSNIMLEAWKKLVLVQCIMNDGSDPSKGMSLPKCTPNCLSQMLISPRGDRRSKRGGRHAGKRQQQSSSTGEEQASKTQTESTDIACYTEIAEVFKSRSKEEFVSLLENRQSILEADGNLGLAQQCLKQLVSNQVRHIAKIYATISIPKMASRLGMDPSQPNIMSEVFILLRDSGVSCELEEDGTTIVFHDTVSGSSSNEMVDLNEWMVLLDKVQRLDVNLLTSSRYQSLNKTKASAPSGPRGVEDI